MGLCVCLCACVCVCVCEFRRDAENRDSSSSRRRGGNKTPKPPKPPERRSRGTFCRSGASAAWEPHAKPGLGAFVETLIIVPCVLRGGPRVHLAHERAPKPHKFS